MNLSNLSDQQQEFLAMMDAMTGPVSLEIAGILSPISSAELSSLIYQATKAGWLRHSDPIHIELTPELPEGVASEIRKLNSPERINRMVQILKSHDFQEKIKPEVFLSLLQKYGEKRDAGHTAFQMALEALNRPDYRAAYACQTEAVSNFFDILGDSDTNRMYFLSVLSMSDIAFSFWSGRNADTDENDEFNRHILDVLHQAKHVAKNLNLVRQLSLVYLHLALHYVKRFQYKKAQVNFRAGFSLVEEIDDAEIRVESLNAYGHYHMMKGDYKKAATYFENVISTDFYREGKPHDFTSPIHLSICLLNLGHFHRAIGLLDSYIHRAVLSKRKDVALIFKIWIGNALLFTEKRTDAFIRLKEAVKEAEKIKFYDSLMYVYRGLAYYYYLEGRYEDSYGALKKCMNIPASGRASRPFYYVPWLMELLFEYDKRGYDTIPGANLDDYLEEMISSPNVHMRGVAYRICAKQAEKRGETLSKIKSLLVQSEHDLSQSEDPCEAAKTISFMAQIELRSGNREKARDLAIQAWEGFFSLADFYMPYELKQLIKIDKKEIKLNSASLKVFSDILDELSPSPSKKEFLNRFMVACCRLFDSERAALFVYNHKKERNPDLYATYNLSEEEINDKGFQKNLNLILTSLKKKTILTDKKAGERAKSGGEIQFELLCLPFSVMGKVNGVMYLDNRYSLSNFDLYGKSLLVNIADSIGKYIGRVMEFDRKIEERISYGHNQQNSETILPEGDIIADSLVMREVMEQADIAAGTDAAILILGETGVGKELLARRIHLLSARKNANFVAINLAAIPETLMESELFGHEKGAFTGADKRKKGHIEIADKGTLFMDEVGDIPKSIQVKLLRLLQEKSFYRVGGIRNISSDFRLITATHQDLKSRIDEGSFREDLYYRFNVIRLILPPLRERGRDIIALAQHFLNKFSKQYLLTVPELSAKDEEALLSYHWPGNVRELENVIERAVIMTGRDPMNFKLPSLSSSKDTGLSKDDVFTVSNTPSMNEIQRKYIQYVLKKTGGKLSGTGGAAEILGMKRQTLYHRMKNLGISGQTRENFQGRHNR